MANITFLKSPAELSLTGNQIRFKIAGKNAFTSADVCAVNKMYFTGSHIIDVVGSLSYPTPDITWVPDGSPRTPENDHETLSAGYIQFKWGAKKVFLYCYDAVQNPIYNYPSGTDDGTYLPALVNWFKQNPTLNADFIIAYTGGGYISFTARKPGPAYNMEFETNQFSNMVVTSGDLERITDNYSIGIRPESGGDVIAEMERPVRHYNNEGTLPADYDADKCGVISVDIADLLKEEKRGHFSFPTPKYWGKNHNLVKQFKLFAYERYGNPPLELGGAFTSDFYALQAKISNFTQGELNYLKKTFLDKLTETGMFLSNAPLEKLTDIYAPERLYYIYGVAGSYKTVVKQYYTDGTDATDTKESYFVSKYQVRELFVSYDKIRTNAPKKLVKYEVYITDSSNNKISETRTFIVDYRYQGWARYFYFKNAYGVYELLRTTGKVSKSRKISKGFVDVQLPDDFIHLDRERKQVSAVIDTTYDINSGFFENKYLAEYFQEFLASEDVYSLKRGAAYPVIIEESKQNVSADGEYNPDAEFTLTHSMHDDFSEEYVAQEPIVVGDFNVDFNTDFFVGQIEELYEIVLDDSFDNWIGSPSVPVGWELIGSSVIANDSNRLKMISSGDSALSFNTSFLTKVMYKLSFTIDSITPFAALYLQIGSFTPQMIKTAGDYSFTFQFDSLSPLSNIFIMHLLALSGATDVNMIMSNIRLEYEYTELEGSLLDDNFDLWKPESSIPLPLGWTAYGTWNATNYLANESGKVRLHTTSATPNLYSLQHNFKLEAGETYQVTFNFEELTGYVVRFMAGGNILGTVSSMFDPVFTFTPDRDFYSFDIKFEGSGTERTALLANFKIEKL